MRELLAYLLNNAPPNLQFLIGSRRPLELQLTDLLAAGRMADARCPRPAPRPRRIARDAARPVRRRASRSTMRCGCTSSPKAGRSGCSWRRPPSSGRRPARGDRPAERAARRHPAVLLRVAAGAAAAGRGGVPRPHRHPRGGQCGDLCRRSPGDPDAASVPASSSRTIAAGDGGRGPRLVAPALDGARFPARAVRQAARARNAAATTNGRPPGTPTTASCRMPHATRWPPATTRWRSRTRRAACSTSRAKGRLAEARDWIRRLPPQALERDVHLQLTVAWITALGEDAATVPSLIEQIRRHPQFDDECRFEAALIAAAAGTFCDQPGCIAEALAGLGPAAGRRLRRCTAVAWPTRRANLAYLQRRFRGRPAAAGGVAQVGIARAGHAPGARLRRHDLRPDPPVRGQPAKAIAVLRPRLELAERELGSADRGAGHARRRAGGRIDAAWRNRTQVARGAGRPARRHRAAGACRTRSCSPTACWRKSRCGEARKRARWNTCGLARARAWRGTCRAWRSSAWRSRCGIHAIHGRTQTAAELLAQIEALAPGLRERALPRHAASLPAHAGACAGPTPASPRRISTAPRRRLRVAADAPPSARRGGRRSRSVPCRRWWRTSAAGPEARDNAGRGAEPRGPRGDAQLRRVGASPAAAIWSAPGRRPERARPGRRRATAATRSPARRVRPRRTRPAGC